MQYYKLVSISLFALSSLAGFAEDFVELCNKDRVAQGLNELCLNRFLNTASMKRAKVLSKNGGLDFGGEDGPLTRARDSRYSVLAISEVLAKGPRTPQEAFSRFKEAGSESGSPYSHLMEPKFKHMGVGESDDVWVVMVGNSKKDVCMGASQNTTRGDSEGSSGPKNSSPVSSNSNSAPNESAEEDNTEVQKAPGSEAEDTGSMRLRKRYMARR